VHSLRKRFKDLRALVECFGPLFDQRRLKQQLLPPLKAIQDNLGDMQDSVVWIENVGKFKQVRHTCLFTLQLLLCFVLRLRARVCLYAQEGLGEQPQEVKDAVDALLVTLQQTQDEARRKFFTLFEVRFGLTVRAWRSTCFRSNLPLLMCALLQDFSSEDNAAVYEELFGEAAQQTHIKKSRLHKVCKDD
jgi:hypothetical protein